MKKLNQQSPDFEVSYNLKLKIKIKIEDSHNLSKIGTSRTDNLQLISCHQTENVIMLKILKQKLVPWK